jgi:hypothetical protein
VALSLLIITVDFDSNHDISRIFLCSFIDDKIKYEKLDKIFQYLGILRVIYLDQLGLMVEQIAQALELDVEIAKDEDN